MRRLREALVALIALALCFAAMPSARAEEPDAPAADQAQRHEREALEHDAAGRHAEALASWKKVLAARPHDQWVRLSFANALLQVRTHESLKQAEKLLVALVELDWQHPTRGDVRYRVDDALAAVLLSRAQKIEGEERARLLGRAITAWERALALQPRYPMALLGLARANLALARDEAGFDFGERYLALCRESGRRWNQQQAMLRAQLGPAATPEQKRVFTEKIESARQKEEEVLLLLASAHMRRKEPRKALARYDAILVSGQDSRDAYFGRAQAYVALKQLDRAVDDLERCLKVATGSTNADLRERATKLLQRCRQHLGKGAPPR